MKRLAKVPIPIVSVHQSPMNKTMWLLTLLCGCEVWYACERKPTRLHYPCQGKCK